MKRMLKRLASDCLFSINERLIKQIDGCSMGSPLSVDLSGIFMTKLEKDVVYPTKPILYERYVDDVFTRKKKHEEDKLLPKLNEYHPKIKFTVEKNLEKFLDTKLSLEGGRYVTNVNRNRKLPMHWSSKVPKRIKRNIVTNDLHRAKKISSNFDMEIREIKEKYEKANYPKKFVESIVKTFNEKDNKSKEKSKDTKEQEKKQLVLIKVPYCEKNEKIAKHFLMKLKQFTENKYSFSIMWQTRKIKTLFSLKDKIKHKSNVIYKGTGTLKSNISYIGETTLIAESRWNQHEDPKHDSAPSKYLNDNKDETFKWEILSMSTSNYLKRKIHEALFIVKHKPELNKQVTHRKLILFRNGVT